MVSDSVVLVQADGLHLFNLYTGQGWDYEAEVSTLYDRRSALKTLGLASGFFTELAVMQSSERITELCSNVILSDSVLLLGFTRGDCGVRQYRWTCVVENPFTGKSRKPFEYF